jgi:shikimate kinase
MSLVLIGYRASGKSTVGRMLAERLGMGFADSDEWIVRRAGRSIREIFADQGEAGFRDLETAAVREIGLLQNHVIALGGGALARKQNLAAIRAGGHKIVYLRCRPAELHKRIHADPATAAARPALTSLGGGIEEIEQILAQREPLWMQIKHAELDVSDISPGQAVDALERLM